MHALRKHKLAYLIAHKYGDDRGLFLKAAGISKGLLSQLLDPKEPFGEVAARNLEDRLQLEPGFFDSMDARTVQFAILFDSLPSDIKARWEQIAQALKPPQD